MCPNCGSTEIYPYDDGMDCITFDDEMERCAACGYVFYGVELNGFDEVENDE